MVILQFNKLIRNKWIWGAFAVLVSVVFCLPDDMLAGRGDDGRQKGAAGTLAGEAVDAARFQAIAESIRGFGRQRDYSQSQGQVNRQAWETYAALLVADKCGIAAGPDEVRAELRREQSFQQNGAFSFRLYQAVLRENGINETDFEEYVRRRIQLARFAQTLLSSAAWASPMEMDAAVADMTDTFTVRVARFSQSKAEADAVKLDDKGLKAWYDKNVDSLALPERVKIRYVRFNARDPKLLARMTVTEDEMHDRYDVTSDKYTTTDTNGVEKVKKFEEVKGEIEKELRQLAAVQCLETNLNFRAYAQDAAKGASRVDEIAKEAGLKVETSDWFAVEGGVQEGFMRPIYQILPGAKELAAAVAGLDPETKDYRYAVVSSDSAVWLIEKAETSPKHTPTFAEAKDAIRARALRDAKADAFKAKVEAVAAKGAKAVLATDTVSTNITFSVSDLQSGAFPDQMEIARASMKLKKGQVSELATTGRGRGLLVVCVDRQAGDAAKAVILRSQVQNDVAMLQMRQIPPSWEKWNLDRLGFETTEQTSVDIDEEAEEK